MQRNIVGELPFKNLKLYLVNFFRCEKFLNLTKTLGKLYFYFSRLKAKIAIVFVVTQRVCQ